VNVRQGHQRTLNTCKKKHKETYIITLVKHCVHSDVSIQGRESNEQVKYADGAETFVIL